MEGAARGSAESNVREPPNERYQFVGHLMGIVDLRDKGERTAGSAATKLSDSNPGGPKTLPFWSFQHGALVSRT